jgi:hypothetical protein
MEGEEEGEKAPLGVEESAAVSSELLSGTAGGRDGVSGSDAKTTIPKCVNMEDVDGAVISDQLST